MTRSFKGTLIGIFACALALAPMPASAQICGYPDASGDITVADGVEVLRTAAQLSSSCTDAICDVDATGDVSVNDGVNVLRASALLSTSLTCGTAASEFVSS